jgi:AcrR family transcriptional regulator
VNKSAADDSSEVRKRPRQARAAATVDAILDAAADILETQGFAGFSTNAVAQRAGASIGSLYQYFSNKNGLIQALLEREHSELLAALTAIRTHGEEPGLRMIDELIDLAVDRQLRRPQLSRLLDGEETRFPATDQTRQLNAMAVSILQTAVGAALIAAQPRLPQDILAVILGMVDTAGQSGETDGEALSSRVRRAVMGCLGIVTRAAGEV